MSSCFWTAFHNAIDSARSMNLVADRWFILPRRHRPRSPERRVRAQYASGNTPPTQKCRGSRDRSQGVGGRNRSAILLDKVALGSSPFKCLLLCCISLDEITFSISISGLKFPLSEIFLLPPRAWRHTSCPPDVTGNNVTGCGTMSAFCPRREGAELPVWLSS